MSTSGQDDKSSSGLVQIARRAKSFMMTLCELDTSELPVFMSSLMKTMTPEEVDKLRTLLSSMSLIVSSGSSTTTDERGLRRSMFEGIFMTMTFEELAASLGDLIGAVDAGRVAGMRMSLLPAFRTLVDSVAEMKEVTSNLAEEGRRMSDKKSALARLVVRLHQDVAISVAERLSVEDQLKSANAGLAAARAELSVRKMEIDEARKGSAQRIKTLRDLSKKMEKEERDAAKKAHDAARAKIAADIEVAKRELDVLLSELASAKSSFEVSRIDLKNTESQCEATKSELDAKRAELELLKQDVQTQKRLLDETRYVEFELARMLKARSGAISLLNSSIKDLANISDKLSIVRAQLDVKRADLKQTEDDLVSTDNRIARTGRSIVFTALRLMEGIA